MLVPKSLSPVLRPAIAHVADRLDVPVEDRLLLGGEHRANGGILAQRQLASAGHGGRIRPFTGRDHRHLRAECCNDGVDASLLFGRQRDAFHQHLHTAHAAIGRAGLAALLARLTLLGCFLRLCYSRSRTQCEHDCGNQEK